MNSFSRRAFLNASLLLLGGTRASATLAAQTTLAAGRRGRAVINSCGGFDLPGDLVQGAAGQSSARILDPGKIRDALASDMIAVNQTLGYVFGDDEPFEQTVRDIGVWDELIRRSPQLIKVYGAQDIERAGREQRLGIIFGFQNAAMLGDRVDRIDLFADLGVRIVQLTYNDENRLARGALVPGTSGLTSFGREVVGKLNARRVIVDLSHSAEQVCLDAARVSTRPLAISHTGCRALAEHPRNVSDEAMRLVASRGGYVGIFFMPYLSPGRNPSAHDLVEHVEHAIKVCGEDHVGIGTDGGTSPIDVKAFQIENAKDYARRTAAGIAAPGESPDVLPFIPELSGPNQFRTLSTLLAARGHGSSRIDKILGGNFLRFAREVWGNSSRGA
jgi:membrane dipeptidase